jgi:hypothetical protein
VADIDSGGGDAVTVGFGAKAMDVAMGADAVPETP